MTIDWDRTENTHRIGRKRNSRIKRDIDFPNFPTSNRDTFLFDMSSSRKFQGNGGDRRTLCDSAK